MVIQGCKSLNEECRNSYMENILLSCRLVKIDFCSVPEPFFTHTENTASSMCKSQWTRAQLGVIVVETPESRWNGARGSCGYNNT